MKVFVYRKKDSSLFKVIKDVINIHYRRDDNKLVIRKLNTIQVINISKYKVTIYQN